MVDYSYRDSPYDTFRGTSQDSGFIDFSEEDYKRFKKYDVDVQSLLSEGYETADISQAAQELEQEEVVKSEHEVIRQESGLAPPPVQSRPTNIPYQDVPPQPVDDSFWQSSTGPLDILKSGGADASSLLGTVVGFGLERLGTYAQSPLMKNTGQFIKDQSIELAD